MLVGVLRQGAAIATTGAWTGVAEGWALTQVPAGILPDATTPGVLTEALRSD